MYNWIFPTKAQQQKLQASFSQQSVHNELPTKNIRSYISEMNFPPWEESSLPHDDRIFPKNILHSRDEKNTKSGIEKGLPGLSSSLVLMTPVHSKS